MLPSTGYFKGLNCPFYDSGLCERPFCHFRHSKNSQPLSAEGIENDIVLQQLVSEAFKKVLQKTDTTVESITSSSSEQASNDASYIPAAGKVTYNPTPISQLNKCSLASTNSLDETDKADPIPKRHIPVPYTPHRPSSLPVKRPINSDIEVTKPFIYNPPEVKYTAGADVKHDPYLPVGNLESKETYQPGGTEKTPPTYCPDEKETISTVHYVPSGRTEKSIKKKNLLEYKPKTVGLSKNENRSIKYHPTPLSQVPCFSSDEEEPICKKNKLNEDLNSLDDLESEFEILGQILDEEKLKESKGQTNSSALKNKDEIQVNKDDIITANTVDNRLESKDKDKQEIDTIKQTKIEKSSSSNKDYTSSSKYKNNSNKSSKEKTSSKHIDKNKERSKDKVSSKSKETAKEKESFKYKEISKDKQKSSKQKIIETKDKKENSTRDIENKSSLNIEKIDKTKIKSESNRGKNSEDEKYKSSSNKSSDLKKAKNSKHLKSSKSHRSHSSEKSKDKVNENRSSNTKNANSDRYAQSEKISDDNCHVDDLVESELVTELSESDEEQIELECKKIFEEYVPTVKIIENTVSSKENDEEYYVPVKKRISHTGDKNIKHLYKPLAKPDFKFNASQAMAQRMEKIKEYHALKNPSSNPLTVQTVPVTHSNVVTPILPKVNNQTGSTKIRIAHVPNVSTLLNAKKIISPKAAPSIHPSTSTTVQTIPKGSSRVAHIPNDKFADRPGVLEPLGSKIPANLRSTYLNMMIDQCIKIYLTPTDAYARAQHEELSTSKKCSKVAVYKNSAVLAVNRLKKEFEQCRGIKKSAADCEAMQKFSHSQVLLGKAGANMSWSIEGKNKIMDFSNEFKGERFYENISHWILTEDQLRENGFPRSHPTGEKGRAYIYVQNNKHKPPKGFIRTCRRCKKDYTVNKKGFSAIEEECIYHPNNKYKVRNEARYQCCGQDAMSDGCNSAPCHVFEYVDYENLRGFVKTMPKHDVNKNIGVYALDCEMCYTTHGLDLTRVTVIDSTCKKVYETLIKPLHPIIDYNTRFSGITEEQMEGVTTTLIEVQATLLSMFSDKTILIGHSLESDFKVLKLIHDTVIDTSVLYPHKMGPPYKRALRNLSSEHLKKIIQNSVDGHDSAEDATVCMELIHFKLKEELKTR